MDLERYPLTNETSEGLLTRLMEECAEVQKLCAKALRFGLRNHHPDTPGMDNAMMIHQELCDVHAVRAELGRRNLVPGFEPDFKASK